MGIIGLLGGMSWESTETYYRLINETVRERVGPLHSAELVLYSVDFSRIDRMQDRGDWDGIARLLANAAKRIEAAGADFLVVCANTAHKVAPRIESEIGIPLLHIVDATADEIRKAGVATVGLLGTKFTMEESFYRGRLAERHGIEVLIPDDEERESIHRVIFDELCAGEIRDESRTRHVEIIEGLAARGAEGVVLGCTELPLLVGPDDSPIPVFDTTAIHARRAAERALEGDGR
jgi:aspartate racemase